jgi:hypothetical protein
MIGNNSADYSATVPEDLPRLVNTCLITHDVKTLVDFYELILMRKAERSGSDYAEFPTGVGVLAIFSAEAQSGIFLDRQKRRRTRASSWNFRLEMSIKSIAGCKV